jgi:hypothetical protein
LEFLLQSLLFTRYAATARGIGHAPFLWELAASERVHYEHVASRNYDSEPDDLLMSFDGSSFAFQPNVDSIEARKSSTSINARAIHPFSVSRAELLPAWDVCPGDATLTVLEGSNTLF